MSDEIQVGDVVRLSEYGRLHSGWEASLGNRSFIVYKLSRDNWNNSPMTVCWIADLNGEHLKFTETGPWSVYMELDPFLTAVRRRKELRHEVQEG